ncbi:MAG: hypothetical protein H7230_02420 [Candidatus Parcubacteria bacterium]|nr:hypothetical protein [Candidatus Paceibacterota bacterium]
MNFIKKTLTLICIVYLGLFSCVNVFACLIPSQSDQEKFEFYNPIYSSTYEDAYSNFYKNPENKDIINAKLLTQVNYNFLRQAHSPDVFQYQKNPNSIVPQGGTLMPKRSETSFDIETPTLEFKVLEIIKNNTNSLQVGQILYLKTGAYYDSPCDRSLSDKELNTNQEYTIRLRDDKFGYFLNQTVETHLRNSFRKVSKLFIYAIAALAISVFVIILIFPPPQKAKNPKTS